MTDHADTIRRAVDKLRALSYEAADLQAADPEPLNQEQRWKDLRDELVMAALYEIPEVLAERQQAIDALREIAAKDDELHICYETEAESFHEATKIARAALLNLEEQE